MGYSFAPFWCLCQKLSLSPLYFNKTLLHKSSERSSLVSVPRLNTSPLEAKNPLSYRSATTFQVLTVFTKPSTLQQQVIWLKQSHKAFAVHWTWKMCPLGPRVSQEWGSTLGLFKARMLSCPVEWEDASAKWREGRGHLVCSKTFI